MAATASLERFLYLGNREAYFLCKSREKSTDVIVNNLSFLQQMVQPQDVLLPYEIIKNVSLYLDLFLISYIAGVLLKITSQLNRFYIH